jgi:hypothetical protein
MGTADLPIAGTEDPFRMREAHLKIAEESKLQPAEPRVVHTHDEGNRTRSNWSAKRKVQES